MTRLDPEKVRAELERRDAEIANHQHLADWLQDQADEATREMYRLKSQRDAFARLAEENR